MTKTHALKRLLEHGPMTRAQIIECTGWTPTATAKVMSRCFQAGLVKAAPGWWPRAYVAESETHGKQVPDLQALDTESRQGHGEAKIRPMRAETALGVPTTFGDMRKALSGPAGRCSGAGEVDQRVTL